MATQIQLIGQEFERHLQEMAKILPKAYRLTLIARHTGRPDSDIILTHDNLVEVATAVVNLAGK